MLHRFRGLIPLVIFLLLYPCSITLVTANPSAFELSLAHAPLIFQGEGVGDWSGYSVAPAGDVNQDGYDDILVGAPYAGPQDFPGNGKAYLILGRERNAWSSQRINLSQADASFAGFYHRSMSGRQNYTAGDVNGDGYDDFLISCWKYRPGESGKVYLFLGNEDIDWGNNFPLDAADISFTGVDREDRAGWYITTTGDVNGDSLDDFLITAVGDAEGGGFRAGTTYLILGRLAADWGQNYSLANADASFIGEAIGDVAGRSVAGAGDVNGDGLADFLIGALYNDDGGVDAGKAYLILGKREADWGQNYPLSLADASFIGVNENDQIGRRVAFGGDINGDGLEDMLFGASYNDQGGEDAGKAFLVYGRPDAGWGTNFSLAYADATFVGEDLLGQAGRRVSGIGDINQDGYDDFIVGAPQTHRYYDEEGTAYLFLGRPENTWGMDFPLEYADLILTGEGDLNHAGFDEAPIGDMDADGISDFLVGAWGGLDMGFRSGLTYVWYGSLAPIPYQLDTNNPPPDRNLYKAYFYDLDGALDMSQLEITLASQPSSKLLDIKARYDAQEQLFYLRSLDGSSWLGPCTSGIGILNNGLVILDCKRSGATDSDSLDTQVSWYLRCIGSPCPIETFYLQGLDLEGHDSGLVEFGH